MALRRKREMSASIGLSEKQLAQAGPAYRTSRRLLDTIVRACGIIATADRRPLTSQSSAQKCCEVGIGETIKRLEMRLRARNPRALRLLMRLARSLQKPLPSKIIDDDLIRECRFCSSHVVILDFLPQQGRVAELGTYKGSICTRASRAEYAQGIASYRHRLFAVRPICIGRHAREMSPRPDGCDNSGIC